jgi:hypothetical protein
LYLTACFIEAVDIGIHPKNCCALCAKNFCHSRTNPGTTAGNEHDFAFETALSHEAHSALVPVSLLSPHEFESQRQTAL